MHTHTHPSSTYICTHTHTHTHILCLHVYAHTHPLSTYVVVAFQFVDLTQNVDEGDVAQICVRLVAGILTNPITVTLTFVSGSATGKY